MVESEEEVCESPAAMQRRQHETGIINPGLHMQAHKKHKSAVGFDPGSAFSHFALKHQARRNLVSCHCHALHGGLSTDYTT